ncbi:MAG: type II toxin-antitoxin system VapC family toxin [Geminicoccaceae bacterium]|nr:type II toxin-antitoxin system VapC family toxin [Geminicoccaceae bacterium]
MIVLDTNVVSELMLPRPDPRVLAWIAEQPISELAITTISLMEVRYGIAAHPDPRRRDVLTAKFHQLLPRGFAGRVLPFDAPAAEARATIRAARKRAGLSDEFADAMIAAIAREAGASVATRDKGGFAGCGVPVVDPWAAA